MSNKTKILHVIQKMHSGGVEQRKLLVAQHLPKNQFEQKIICSEADIEFKNKFEKAGCEVIEIGYLKHPFDFKTIRKAIRVIKKFKPNIIHGAVYEGNTIAAFAGLYCQVPIRVIEETSLPIHRSSKAKYLFKLFTRITHKTVAISPAVEEYLKSQKINPNKIQLITNGVKDPIFLNEIEKKDLRNSLGIKTEDIVFGSVGRMENDVKGFDLLIQKFAKICQQFQNVKLIIIGGGKKLPEYVSLAKELKVSGEIIFTNYQTNPHKFYEIMDIYISIPRSEGFGLSFAEAMSHSLPLIGSNVGGVKNLIQENENGFISEMHEIENNMITLIEGKNLRERLGDFSYQFYLKHYNSQVFINKTVDFYRILRFNVNH